MKMSKSTRKSLIGPKEGRNSVGNFSTRFSLPSFVKRVKKLTDNQRNAIKRMGFGNVLQIPNQMLIRNLLVELMERWSCEKRAFILIPGEIPITLMDIALILGLRVTGNPVIIKEDVPFSELEREYGAALWNRNITIASIEERLESLGEADDEDFIRSFLLFTFGTLLFPNTKAKVDSRYLYFLRDLDKVCHLAWGAAVLADVINWLSKRKKTNVQYVGGCLIFLQIWSYEHIDIARPYLLAFNLAFPRVCYWGSTKSYQRQWFTSKFKELENNQILWKLQPTSEESEIGIIKELLEAQIEEKELDMALYSSIDASIDDEQSLRIRPDFPASFHHVQEEQKEQIELPRISPGTSTVVIISDDDEDELKTRNRILEEQNIRLKEEIDGLRKENKLLKTQLLSSPKFEDQHVELRKEIENLRKDNLLLGLSANCLVARLESLVSDEHVNAMEEKNIENGKQHETTTY